MTSVVCKVFERILKRAILSLLSECKPATGCQHGFLPYRSCPSYLLILEETIARLMDDGNAAHAVYLDFAMAFDSVNHRFIWTVFKSRPIDQTISGGKSLQNASGRCVVARDKDQEWGTSWASDRATSILVVCQRPPKCNQCDNAAFRRWPHHAHKAKFCRAPSTKSRIGR